jgi:hypothetical protein
MSVALGVVTAIIAQPTGGRRDCAEYAKVGDALARDCAITTHLYVHEAQKSRHRPA